MFSFSTYFSQTALSFSLCQFYVSVYNLRAGKYFKLVTSKFYELHTCLCCNKSHSYPVIQFHGKLNLFYVKRYSKNMRTHSTRSYLVGNLSCPIQLNFTVASYLANIIVLKYCQSFKLSQFKSSF